MASANTSCSEENFSCSICLDAFDSPVTTACGHNFCRTCITKFWDLKVQYKCPVCNELFHTRPDLRVNILLSETVEQLRSSVRVKEQPCVRPGEVPCDICTGTQPKAVRSCLVCLISYCQTHLEPHQRVAGLKKHRLVEPMERLEDRMCKKHNQLLELFCRTEQVSVCQFCTETDHKSHPVVPLKEEYEVKTAQLGKIEAKVPRMIQERKLKIEEIKEAFRSLKDPPPTRDWTTVEVRPPSSIGTFWRSLDQLKVTLNMDTEHVTLDPYTAHPELIPSEDGKQEHHGIGMKL
ncbi:unnamed protein product [Arctogadus glacialis]